MFRLFDKDGDRSISTSEMGQVLRGLGFDMTNRELAQALKKIDTNGRCRVCTVVYIVDIRWRCCGVWGSSTNRELAEALKKIDTNGRCRFVHCIGSVCGMLSVNNKLDTGKRAYMFGCIPFQFNYFPFNSCFC